MKSILYYIHDPMCSWCWGFSESLSELLVGLPEDIKVQRLLGGLAADSDEIMPEQMQQSIQQNWSRIEQTIPNVKFNFDFWQKTAPRRSTYPACRAVITARKQGEEFDVKMTTAIQSAYYQNAKNPSDNDVLISLAEELKLNKQQFAEDLISIQVNNLLQEEISFSREMFVESYPSLVFEHDDEAHSIRVNYTNSKKMLDEIVGIYQSK
ncbi:MAG: DsbA family protein [Woeseiaceae bacterium]